MRRGLREGCPGALRISGSAGRLNGCDYILGGRRMMSSIFSLSAGPAFVIFAVIGGVFYGSGRIALWLLAKPVKQDVLAVPVGAFIGTISTAWALSLGFVAADIWIVNAKANQAASEERSSIARMIGSASVRALQLPELATVMMEYREAVAEEEWGQGKNATPSAHVELILQRIRGDIVMISQSQVPGPIVAQFVNDFDELQDARNTRLSIGATSVDMYKWYLLFSLTFLTLVTIACAHADRPRAGKKAILIYSVTGAMCLWILAIHASPYQGAEPMTPDVLVVSIDASAR